MPGSGGSTRGEVFGRCTALLQDLQGGARRTKLAVESFVTMLYSRQNRNPLRFLPDESRSLPPPNLTDPRILYLGFLGYCSGLLDNYIYRRPVLKA
ncbi:hypothetical protein P7K49_022389, partial [Saguinus oedipus]